MCHLLVEGSGGTTGRVLPWERPTVILMLAALYTNRAISNRQTTCSSAPHGSITSEYLPDFWSKRLSTCACLPVSVPRGIHCIYSRLSQFYVGPLHLQHLPRNEKVFDLCLSSFMFKLVYLSLVLYLKLISKGTCTCNLK